MRFMKSRVQMRSMPPPIEDLDAFDLIGHVEGELFQPVVPLDLIDDQAFHAAEVRAVFGADHVEQRPVASLTAGTRGRSAA